MTIAELIGRLMAELVEHGDIDVKLDSVPKYDTHIRGFYKGKSEWGSDVLYIEPIDR